MSVIAPLSANRRSIFKWVAGAGAATLALPLVSRHFGEEASFSLIGSAKAQGMGAQRSQGSLVFIPGASVPVVQMAEWVDPNAPTGPNRTAGSKEAYDKAPPTACRYESKLYNFPSGSIRTLTFKKGGPVFHQITFEREIYVLQGSATLTPLKGHAGKPTPVNAGDALFLPSGVLVNETPTEDLILILFMVGSASKSPKASIVPSSGGTETLNVNWQKDGKEFTANTPEDAKKAPADARRYTTKRYLFDGNSIRVATLQKGEGRTNSFVNNRLDILIYLAKGRLRRKEGDQTFEMVAGDAMREKLGNTGYWEILEDSVFVATDAPVNPGIFAPSEIAAR
jgi:uncharacterized cupin superfamily protein